SVGRGTDRPFEMIGAPWIDGVRLAAALREQNLPGARFVPVRFTPASSIHAGKECGGVQIFLDDWQRFEPLLTGITIACALKKLYPSDWQSQRYQVLLAHPPTLEALERGEAGTNIVDSWRKDLELFEAVRKKYLLYQ